MAHTELLAASVGPMSILSEIREGADTITLQFSSRNKAARSFHRYPTPIDVSRILINPADLNWYLDGVPDLNGFDATVSYLQSMVEKSGASRVVCMGSSMGAWGAAYLAPHVGAKAALLFGPELRLNCFGSYSFQNIGHRTDVPTIAASPSCDYVIIAGMQSPCDVYGTLNFMADADQSACYFMPRMGHATAYPLNQLGVLDSIVESVVRGQRAFPVLDALNYSGKDDLRKFFMGRDYDMKTISDYINAFFNDSSMDIAIRGIASDLVSKKLHAHAFSLLWQRYERGAMPADMKMILLNAARKSKRSAQALKLAEELCHIPAYARDAHWQKALVLKRLNRTAEAVQALKVVCGKHMDDPVFKAASDELKTLAS